MSRKSRSPEGLLPLRPTEFHVLVTLSKRDRHGYGIVQDIAERTRGRVNLVPGNLYPVLRRLVDAGLIEEGVEQPVDELDHKQRRYYAITQPGKRVAAEEAQRLKTLIEDDDVKALIAGWSQA